jgi:hypothetical protein
LLVLHEGIPLIIGHDELGVNFAMVFDVNGELWEKVFFILVNAAEPMILRHIFHARYRSHLVSIRYGHRLDQANSIDNYQPIRAGNINPPAECAVHYG